MLQTKRLTRIPPIIIEYVGIGGEQHLPTNISNQMPEAAFQDFENAFKIGIIKQLERNGRLTADQSALLVRMQRTERTWEHGQPVR